MSDGTPRDLSKVCSGDFETCLDTTFELRLDDDGRLPLRLIEVDGPPEAAEGEAPRTRPFSLLFKGPPETFLKQRIYRLEHTRFGRVDLFLVPVGQQTDGYLYESIFN